MRVPSFTLRLLGLMVLLGLAGATFAQQVSDDVLKKLLERYPAADANKDGTLTPEEARAFRLKMTGKSAAQVNQPTPADQQSARAAKKAKRAAGPDIKPDHANLNYGPHANNKLDLWLAKSDK